MASIALLMLILVITGSGFLMGTVGGLELATLLVIGIPAGVWVDRWNRKYTMIIADFGRTILIAMIPIVMIPIVMIPIVMIPIVIWMKLPLLPIVIIAVLFSGILSVFFGAAYTGSIPRIVRPEQIGQANGYIEAIESIAYIFGPPVAGILIPMIGAAATLGINALSFFGFRDDYIENGTIPQTRS